MTEPPIVDRVRTIAKSMGWGIGVHGSLRRDIDLIAVPWTAEAVPWTIFKGALCEQLGYHELNRDTVRPHGRRTALLVAHGATHEQELHNQGEFIGPPDPKGQWVPQALDLSFVDVREMAAPTARPAYAGTLAPEHDIAIWCEGFAITGDRGEAQLVCTIKAPDFTTACDRAHAQGLFRGFGEYDRIRQTLWGCRLFDNERQAREQFG